jgi:hypothetical protein
MGWAGLGWAGLGWAKPSPSGALIYIPPKPPILLYLYIPYNTYTTIFPIIPIPLYLYIPYTTKPLYYL